MIQFFKKNNNKQKYMKIYDFAIYLFEKLKINNKKLTIGKIL